MIRDISLLEYLIPLTWNTDHINIKSGFISLTLPALSHFPLFYITAGRYSLFLFTPSNPFLFPASHVNFYFVTSLTDSDGLWQQGEQLPCHVSEDTRRGTKTRRSVLTGEDDVVDYVIELFCFTRANMLMSSHFC